MGLAKRASLIGHFFEQVFYEGPSGKPFGNGRIREDDAVRQGGWCHSLNVFGKYLIAVMEQRAGASRPMES